uniref:Uncharacterized protein n=1 Tax=Ditylenchus dipsaci TaxID=166011 RepID=A0A915DZM2_9BILA
MSQRRPKKKHPVSDQFILINRRDGIRRNMVERDENQLLDSSLNHAENTLLELLQNVNDGVTEDHEDGLLNEGDAISIGANFQGISGFDEQDDENAF